MTRSWVHPDLKPGFEVVSSTLLALFPDVDRAYLEHRVRYESAGDHGLEILTA